MLLPRIKFFAIALASTKSGKFKRQKTNSSASERSNFSTCFSVAVTSGEHDRHHFEPIKGSEEASAPFGPDKPIADDPGTEAGA